MYLPSLSRVQAGADEKELGEGHNGTLSSGPRDRFSFSLNKEKGGQRAR